MQESYTDIHLYGERGGGREGGRHREGEGGERAVSHALLLDLLFAKFLDLLL